MSDRETTRERETSPSGEAYDSEIGYGLLLKLGFGLLAIVVVSAVLVYFLFARFLDWERAQEPEPPVLIEARAPVLVPGAKLLAEPEGYLAAYEADVATRLHGYGWVDEGQGTVHIPIERAIEIVAERGLPSRAETSPAPAETEAGEEPPDTDAPTIEAVQEPGAHHAEEAEEDDTGDETAAADEGGA